MSGSAVLASAVTSRPPVDFSRRPMLVFWETTRACLLACRHCRASATTQPPPGELSTAEGRALIEQVAGFGRPYPILVLTGGDCLLRPGLFDLVEYAVLLGVPVCLSPSVTPRLDAAMIGRIAASGVRAVSVSLDGARGAPALTPRPLATARASCSSHDGEVYPAGFLPLGLGSIRARPLPEIYRDDPLLESIRAARFTGRCGSCEYADLCGGSRGGHGRRVRLPTGRSSPR
jgi:MoaA/NifB/PqqE/SkfB family radical SAM enzyme